MLLLRSFGAVQISKLLRRRCSLWHGNTLLACSTIKFECRMVILKLSVCTDGGTSVYCWDAALGFPPCRHVMFSFLFPIALACLSLFVMPLFLPWTCSSLHSSRGRRHPCGHHSHEVGWGSIVSWNIGRCRFPKSGVCE